MRLRKLAALATGLCLGAGLLPAARAAEVRVLSAGAVEPGLDAVAAEFERRTGDHVVVTFATAPALLARVTGGAKGDVLVAPEAVATTLAARGLVEGSMAPVGVVGIGVVVRRGGAHPDVSTVETLKQALLAARRVVYNRASTGQYVEALLGRLGVAGQVEGRTDRQPDGEAVLRRLQAGSGDEIGFAAITEVALARDHGEPVELVAPLPAAVQNLTTYSATLFPGASASAKPFFDLLTGPEGRRIMTAHGVDPPHAPPPGSTGAGLRGRER